MRAVFVGIAHIKNHRIGGRYRRNQTDLTETADVCGVTPLASACPMISSALALAI
jgi:hypothetical protein